MIRITSLAFQADKTSMMLQLGFWDPERLLPRTKMTMKIFEAIKAFQDSMKLVGGTFDVERMVDYMVARKDLNPEICRVVVFDVGNGIGAEWNRPTLQTLVDLVARPLKSLSEEELASKMAIAMNENNDEVIDECQNEYERRKV